MTIKMKLAKWRQNHILLFFSNACSILKLMLCKVSTSNFVYFWLQSMTLQNERAFEEKKQFSIRIRLKRILIRQLKRTINQCKISYMRKNTFFFVRMYCYKLLITSLWYWKSLLANFLVFWKWCPEILFLNLNLTVLRNTLNMALLFSQRPG